MPNRNCWHIIFAPLLAFVLLSAPGILHAQSDNFDFPLPQTPNMDGSLDPKREPLRFVGNYCTAFGGISLQSNPTASFPVDVVGKPVAAYFVWSGRDKIGAVPDTAIQLSGNAGITRTVTADVALDAHSVLAKANGVTTRYSWLTQAYEAVQGGFPAIEQGRNIVTVSGLDFNERHGSGVIVISEDPDSCPFQSIDLFFGNDILYFDWPSPSGPDSAVTCIDFPAPPEAVEIDIQMFVGGVADRSRANALWFATGGNNDEQPSNLVDQLGKTIYPLDYITMPLQGLNGVEFDNYDTVVQDPTQDIIARPGDTWACFQIESPKCAVPGSGCTGTDPRFADVPNVQKGISATWINLAVRIPLFDISIEGTAVNSLGASHTFTVTVDSSFGITATEGLTITPKVEPLPEFMSDTCATPTLTGKTATCTVTINSSTSGVFTATAEALIDVGDRRTARAITNGVGDSSGPAVKTYINDVVVASVDIEKATNGKDADTPVDLMLQIGAPVTWTYRIENTGGYDLDDVVVADDNGTPLDASDNYTCTIGFLAIGAVDSDTCSQTGTAVEGQYVNIGTVVGTPVQGGIPTGAPNVTDQDPSHYLGVEPPDIIIEKLTNGEDADTPTGPYIAVGQAINWTYMVTNTGDVTLSEVTVTDDKGVSASCPKTVLVPDESMTCTASGIAAAGQYANVGTVTGKTSTGNNVSDTDPSHYFGEEPAVDLEKATNGEDADEPTGPKLAVGAIVTWTYEVTNTGNVTLTELALTDNRSGVIPCPEIALTPGRSMTCIANGVVEAGQYTNEATVAGKGPGGTPASDKDRSHYIGFGPDITIEKYTNGNDADAPPGPTIRIDEPVTWTYLVTNTGTVTLTDVTVVDSEEGAIPCPPAVLVPGEATKCDRTGTAQEGQYQNEATVTGIAVVGAQVVTDTDKSHYFGCASPCFSLYLPIIDNAAVPSKIDLIQLQVERLEWKFDFEKEIVVAGWKRDMAPCVGKSFANCNPEAVTTTSPSEPVDLEIAPDRVISVIVRGDSPDTVFDGLVKLELTHGEWITYADPDNPCSTNPINRVGPSIESPDEPGKLYRTTMTEPLVEQGQARFTTTYTSCSRIDPTVRSSQVVLATCDKIVGDFRPRPPAHDPTTGWTPYFPWDTIVVWLDLDRDGTPGEAEPWCGLMIP